MEGKQKDVNLVLKKLINDVEHACLTCGAIVRASIFGLFERHSGALVSIMNVHAKRFMCRRCNEAEKNSKRYKVLTVSDCCHKGYRTVDITRYDASYEKDEMYICDGCSRECKAIEVVSCEIKTIKLKAKPAKKRYPITYGEPVIMLNSDTVKKIIEQINEAAKNGSADNLRKALDVY